MASTTSSPSMHFQMIHQQMMASTTSSSDIVRTSSRSDVGTFDERMGNDSPLPTRLDASAFTSVLSSNLTKTIDRDQALRHSHVMETVRSLPLDERTGRLQSRTKSSAGRSLAGGNRSRLDRKSAALPAAPAKRQAVATSRSSSIASSSISNVQHCNTSQNPKSRSASSLEKQTAPTRQHPGLRRYTSDPSGMGSTRSTSTSGLSRPMNPPSKIDEGSPNSHRSLTRRISLPSGSEEKARVRPPRQLPPLGSEEAKPKVVRSTSLSSASQAGLGTHLGERQRGASLKDRPSTGVPHRRPGEESGYSSKAAQGGSGRKPVKAGVRKPSLKLRVRSKFIIPSIVITTCPDMEMPETMPVPVMSQSYDKDQRQTSGHKQSTSSFARKAAQLRRSHTAAQAASTTMGSFSVSY